jgi:hypothetical protein
MKKFFVVIFTLLALVVTDKAMAMPPLHEAIDSGSINQVIAELEKGVDVNERNSNGETALIFAVSKGQIDIVKLLIDKGADVNAKTTGGDLPKATALVYAAANGNVDIVELLLDKGANIEATFTNRAGNITGTPLVAAAFSGNPYLIKILVNRGANIEKAIGSWYNYRTKTTDPKIISTIDGAIAFLEKLSKEPKIASQSKLPSSPQEKEASSAQPKEGASVVFLPIPANVNFGNYYAVIIGNNAYRYLPRLTTAVKDARDIAELLQTAYGFKVTLLTDATRQQIIDALDQMRRTLTEQDNLLIYYAGHGWLDVEADRGFWLPVDADENKRAGWLSNSDITDTARSTRAKHILVVVDSCYAGTLTRGVSPQLDNPAVARLAQKRARTALTSGGLEPVADAGGEGHSVFAKAFLDALRENQGVVDMGQLSLTVRYRVMLGAQQTPQYGDIRQTGHEGGDFLFVRQR